MYTFQALENTFLTYLLALVALPGQNSHTFCENLGNQSTIGCYMFQDPPQKIRTQGNLSHTAIFAEHFWVKWQLLIL